MKRRVYIVGSPFLVKEMFLSMGWIVAKDIKSADLIQFVGGADVHPRFYGEKQHPETSTNLERDLQEKKFFRLGVFLGKPMAGICRGGQFLNVMNGGKLWQHVNKHAIQGTHPITDVFTKETFQATSTHHQLMRHNPATGVVIGVAHEATLKERMSPFSNKLSIIGKSRDGSDRDEEIVFYRGTKCFCFQPHPEYQGHKDLTERYFDYIEDYCFGGKEK